MTDPAADLPVPNRASVPEAHVGQRLREMRTCQGLSLRALADRSGLNVNTLSLIENEKSSPSVSTLQQLAIALRVPITDFFQVVRDEQRVVFTPAGNRPSVTIGSTMIEDLGRDLAGKAVEPFVVHLGPGMGSCEHAVVHTGHEFVYGLHGRVDYQVDGVEYCINPGDSLVFEAHLPHCWQNRTAENSAFLFVLYPADEREEPGGRHFAVEILRKEINMKIAAITEDGKTISQHFGRAPYYLVLTVEEGQVVKREMRDKLGHQHFHDQEGEGALHHSHQGQHGQDEASHGRHMRMAEAISDCQVLLCGGMGMGAYQSMQQLNIQPVVTDLENIDEAVQSYITGSLTDHTERLH